MPGMEQPSQSAITSLGPLFLDWSTVNVPQPYDAELDDPVKQHVTVRDLKLADYMHHVRGFVYAVYCDNNPIKLMSAATMSEVDMGSPTQFAGTADGYTVQFDQNTAKTPWPAGIIDRADVITTHWSEATIGRKE